MSNKEFFSAHPNLDEAYKVGDDFFFPQSFGSAREYAERTGLKVEIVRRDESGQKDSKKGAAVPPGSAETHGKSQEELEALAKAEADAKAKAEADAKAKAEADAKAGQKK